jgi:hypothetical protein
VHVPTFHVQYQRWSGLGDLSTVSDVEFSILVLRVGWYAAQFLPSPTYTLDSIRGMPLWEIRRRCSDISELLLPFCSRLDPRGCLWRVQHMALAGLGALCEGKAHAFWEALDSSIRVAQNLGMHVEAERSDANIMAQNEQRERLRTFYSLSVINK